MAKEYVHYLDTAGVTDIMISVHESVVMDLVSSLWLCLTGITADSILIPVSSLRSGVGAASNRDGAKGNDSPA